jgi:hypothetical protein
MFDFKIFTYFKINYYLKLICYLSGFFCDGMDAFMS